MKKILMVILDGFGVRSEKEGNAILSAHMPSFNYLLKNYPWTTLKASEKWVGLPEGQFGNSEVGHTTIGAGKVIKSKMNIINDALDDKTLINDPKFVKLINNAMSGSSLHLMGLISDGRVHSDIMYIKRIITYLKSLDLGNVYIHVITDGRDTRIDSAYKYIKEIEDLISDKPNFKIVSISGRYYAMDRDKNYDRVEKYYNTVVYGEGIKIDNISDYLSKSYSEKVYDEFIVPALINEEGLIKENDSLLWLNFRPDRAREILHALSDDDFKPFKVKKLNLTMLTFFPVEDNLNIPYLYPDVLGGGITLGKYLSSLNMTQARIAETEKYAHVTYYFDGGYEGKLKGADYFLLDSLDVPTYDMKPEMRAYDICDKVLESMDKGYDFILVNFANSDMVGHTGNFKATVKALEDLDNCLGKIINKLDIDNYTMFLLADHGNADYMIDDEGSPVTSHSIYPVPFIITDKSISLNPGSLADVAPTMLCYLGLDIPSEMKNSKVLIGKIE